MLVSIYDIVCCVLALMLEQGLFRNQALTDEKNFLTQLVHIQEEQYRTSKANVEMVNIKCHDMKHQISHITSTTDPDAIRELEQIISVYDSSLQTGNEILDVCLMEKKLLCEKNSIKLDCIANGQCLSFMQPSDLFSLFGNALDNAMEAVCKLDDVEKRIIFVSVKEELGMAIIHVENNYTGELIMADGIPRTSKDDEFYKRSNGGWMGAKPEQIFVAEVPMADYTDAVRASYADYADAAIVVISRVGGEGSDMPTGDFGDGSKYLALQEQEKALLREIKDSGKFSKIIALINTSNAMELGWVDQEAYGIDACLWIGGVGQSGARAVAKALCGEVNPSGRLVDTYAADSYSAPAMQNFGDYKYTNKDDALAVIGGNFGTNYVVYQEGIYVGYFASFGTFSGSRIDAAYYQQHAQCEEFASYSIDLLYVATGTFDFALPQQLMDYRAILAVEPRLRDGENAHLDIFPMRYHSMGNWHLALYNFLQRVFR